MNMFGFGSVAVKKKDSKTLAEVQKDRLRADAIVNADQTLLWTAGIPGTADALAFEPVQGLVAIATSDGKVKLLGRPGCEATVYSAARYPYATRQLQFLQNNGVVVRVSKGGFMESWSVTSGSVADGGVRSLGTVKVRGDKICCVADMARDPYVLLGCASGSLRIATLVDGSGTATSQPLQARGFTIAPYRVRPHELRGEGEVRQLAVQSFGPIHRALVLFTQGMVAVWDVRAVELTTSINPSSPDAADYAPALADAGEATAVCWIGTDRGDFATGHVDGSVLVWALQGLEPGKAAVAAVMRVVSGAAEPIRMLRCVFGEVDGLLVLGGQEFQQPEGLTWMPLPGANEDTTLVEEEEEEEEDGEKATSDIEAETDDGEEEEGRGSGRSGKARRQQPQRTLFKLPWFGQLIGFSLVLADGCVTGYEALAAVLQLMEGGQLVLYSLQDEQPHMVSPYLQQRTPITVTEAPLVPVRRPAGCSPNSITLTSLRKVAAAVGKDLPGGAASYTAVFTAGTPPPMPSDATWSLLYCTGYKDGGVCLWDLHGGTAQLLCEAPAGDAVMELKRSGPSSGAVTCLSLVWPTGLLLAGHQKGEVRVYQFSSSERHVDCITMESINTPGSVQSLHQPAGLQLRLRVLVSSGEITSLAYCQAIRAVAVGDKAGGVALVDTAKPLVRWYAMPAQNAVLGCALAPLPLPPARLRVPEVVGEEGAPAHAVVIADSEGRLAALDAASGCFIGRNGELSPKNHSYTLMLELLDESFTPIWSRRQIGAGCNQAALGGCASGLPKGRSSRALDAGGEEGDDGFGYTSQQQWRQGEGRRSRGRGRRAARTEDEGGSDGEDSEAEDIDGMDVETLLAQAAMQAGEGGSGTTPGRHRSGGAARSREHNRRGGQGTNDLEDGSAPPPVLTSCPDPAAHYVLLVTDQYLRLYSASHVMTAERATVAKRSPVAQQRLVYARPIQVADAPGVMALVAAERGLCVQVYSLPSLELIHEAPLSSSLSLFWDVPQGHERRLGRLAATSRVGHLLLLGLSNELLTLGLAAGLPRPGAPRALFDQAAATASLTATAAFEDGQHVTEAGRLLRRRGRGSLAPATQLLRVASALGSETPGRPSLIINPNPAEMMEGIDSPIVRTEGRRVDKGPATAAAVAATATAAISAVPRAASGRVSDAAKEANVTLIRVFSRVQQGLSRAVEETTRGVRQLATNVEKGVATMIDGGSGSQGAGAGVRGRSAEWYASQPELGAIFTRAVPDDNETVNRTGHKHRQQRPAGRYQEDDTGDEDDEDEEDEDVSILTVSDDEDEEDVRGDAAARREGDGAAAAPRAAGPPSHPRPQARPANPMPPAAGVATGAARGARPQPAAAGRSAGSEDAAQRNELFAGARPYTSTGCAAFGASRPNHPATDPSGVAQPRARTADEIKRAYGRQSSAATARSNEVKSVMEQNRSKLEERGEKLRQLNDKAVDLENSAAGFAEMARQLAERERNKKWWQL